MILILYWLLGVFSSAMDAFNNLVSPNVSTFQFSSNVNWQALLSYMLQSNHFFPMDTYFVIALLYFGIYALLTSAKIIEVVLNVLRGSGIRI